MKPTKDQQTSVSQQSCLRQDDPNTNPPGPLPKPDPPQIATLKSTRTQIAIPRAHDPLDLGDDVFHCILSYLSGDDLVAIDSVSKDWRAFMVGAQGLWRRQCLQQGITPDGSTPDTREHCDWRCLCHLCRRVMSRRCGAIIDWRILCKHHCLPKAWAHGNCTVSYLSGPTVRALHLEDDWIVCSCGFQGSYHLTTLDPETSEGVLDNLDTHGAGKDMVVGAGYLVLHDRGLLEYPPGSVWRTGSLSARRRAGYQYQSSERRKLEYVCDLDWLSQCRWPTIHLDRACTDDASPVLAAVNTTTIHICHLEDGMRREIIQMPYNASPMVNVDDDYIFVYAASLQPLRIFSRKTRAEIVTCWLLYEDIRLAYHIKIANVAGTDDAATQNSVVVKTVASYDGPHLLAKARQQSGSLRMFKSVEFTFTDLVLRYSKGIAVVPNYRQVLDTIESLPAKERSKFLASRTFICTFDEVLRDGPNNMPNVNGEVLEMTTYGHRIALTLHRNPLSPNLEPRIPIVLDARQFPRQPWSSETWRDSPPLQTLVLQRVEGTMDVGRPTCLQMGSRQLCIGFCAPEMRQAVLEGTYPHEWPPNNCIKVWTFGD